MCKLLSHRFKRNFVRCVGPVKHQSLKPQNEQGSGLFRAIPLLPERPQHLLVLPASLASQAEPSASAGQQQSNHHREHAQEA